MEWLVGSYPVSDLSSVWAQRGDPLPHLINNIPWTGKKACFPRRHPPQGPLRRLTQLGRGSWPNVVTHREQKCLCWGMGCFRLRYVGGSSTYSTLRTQHIIYCRNSQAHAHSSYKQLKWMPLLSPTWTPCLISILWADGWKDKRAFSESVDAGPYHKWECQHTEISVTWFMTNVANKL